MFDISGNPSLNSSHHFQKRPGGMKPRDTQDSGIQMQNSLGIFVGLFTNKMGIWYSVMLRYSHILTYYFWRGIKFLWMSGDSTCLWQFCGFLEWLNMGLRQLKGQLWELCWDASKLVIPKETLRDYHYFNQSAIDLSCLIVCVVCPYIIQQRRLEKDQIFPGLS